MSSHHRPATYTALFSLGCAAFLVPLLTMQWTPDCGGLAYGVPLPFLQSYMGSSQRFTFLIGSFVLDVAAYTTLLTAPLLVLHRWISPRWLLLPWALALAGGAFLWEDSDALLWPRERLYVFAWRSRQLHLGPAQWGSHLEAECD